MRASLKLLFAIGLATLIAFGLNMANSNVSFAEAGSEGGKLFQANCLGCHSIGGGDRVGPDLMGVTEKRDAEWLVQMIQDPQSLVDSGDETAVQLVEEYGMVMPKMNLTSAEVDSILNYLQSYSSQSGTASSQNDSAASQNSMASSQNSSANIQRLTDIAWYGVSGTLILFVMMGVIWRGRLRGVRRNLD